VVPADWRNAGQVDYLYRKDTILTREQDRDRVGIALRQILIDRAGIQFAAGEELPQERVSAGVFRIMVPPAQLPLPDILDILDGELRPGVATLDHLVYVCGYPCPATEPEVVPPGTVDPFPPPGLNSGGSRPCHRVPGPGCDGNGVFVSIVDTGLVSGADSHPWLAGVDGAPEEAYDPPGSGSIRPYAGHGTFAAGVMRCMAPRASAYVEAGFNITGAGAAANFESMLPPSLEDAIDRDPDILVFTFTTSTRGDQALLIFEDFYERRIRPLKGLAVLAPAGNDGWSRPMWPAASHEVISVGALAADWRNRAYFSNYGRWVDVYAPGQDLINAFPAGTYVTSEPPAGQHRQFDGMAKWSGTSFSTPLVAGLIAARMSATGENARQAADSLLRLACDQAIPGVGAVLYPGQACCETCRCRH
jgi:hypothetical protein